MRNLFERMNAALTSHEVTIILFARLYYAQFRSLKDVYKALHKNNPQLHPDVLDTFYNCYNINKDKDIFQDIYIKVGTFEPSKNNWESVLKNIKRIFNYFPSLIRWKHNNSTVKGLVRAYPASSFCKNR